MRLANWKIAAYLTSALLVALLVARQIGESQISNDLYQITEWRIFYPGHFIRRGLRGEFVHGLSQLTNIHPDTLIRCGCTLAYSVLSLIFTLYLFGWLWDKARSWIPILLLSPAGLFFYQNAILSVDRFDVFFLLLTVCHLEVCVRSPNEKTYTALSVALFSTLGVAAVLSHEAFLLLCMPVNIILSSWRLGRLDSRLFVIYGLPTLAGGFCLFTPVSHADTLTLAQTLNIPIGSFEWYNGPIDLLAISPIQQVEVVRNIFSADAVRPFLLTAIFFGLIHFGALRKCILASEFAVQIKEWTRPQSLWRDLLIIPALFTLPLYVVAADYGRWFVMVVATFTICCSRLLQVNTSVKRASRLWNFVALALCLFVPIPLSLRFPHSSPELLTWTGAAMLGHVFPKPPPRFELKDNLGVPPPKKRLGGGDDGSQEKSRTGNLRVFDWEKLSEPRAS